MDTQKLPPKFKKKWVDALKGGEYEQGKGALCDGGKYCCLGVAAIVAGYRSSEICGLGTPYDLVEVPDLLRLSGDVRAAMIDFNDCSGMPFEVIAGFVQENL